LSLDLYYLIVSWSLELFSETLLHEKNAFAEVSKHLARYRFENDFVRSLK